MGEIYKSFLRDVGGHGISLGGIISAVELLMRFLSGFPAME